MLPGLHRKITIVLNLSLSVLNLVKVCHKSVSLVIAICTLSCPVSNCFWATPFLKSLACCNWFFIVISCLWPNKGAAPNEILIENDYRSDWRIAGSKKKKKERKKKRVPKKRWLKARSQRLPHTVVPDGTFTVQIQWNATHNPRFPAALSFVLDFSICRVLRMFAQLFIFPRVFAARVSPGRRG